MGRWMGKIQEERWWTAINFKQKFRLSVPFLKPGLNAKLMRARCSFWKPVQHDMLFERWKQILFYTNTTHGKLVKPPTKTFQ